MNRTLLSLTLVLAAGVALAEGPPETAPAPVTEAQEAAKPVAPAAAVDAGPAAEPGKKDDTAPEPADADPAAQAGPKMISGMSILGNQEAPTSLVIVPWKSSVIGDAIGISTMLDDSRQPVDREVFLRALSYYEIRSGKMP